MVSGRFLRASLSLTYLVDGNDLTGGLLDLLQAAKEVPVPGLGNDGVGSEDAHAVQSGRRVGLGRQMPANDLVFLETAYGRGKSVTASSVRDGILFFWLDRLDSIRLCIGRLELVLRGSVEGERRCRRCRRFERSVDGVAVGRRLGLSRTQVKILASCRRHNDNMMVEILLADCPIPFVQTKSCPVVALLEVHPGFAVPPIRCSPKSATPWQQSQPEFRRRDAVCPSESLVLMSSVIEPLVSIC